MVRCSDGRCSLDRLHYTVSDRRKARKTSTPVGNTTPMNISCRIRVNLRSLNNP